ncbi:hypothetical protein QAD02_016536 [Eretmocerus hayati]|uniref:Uncharacterized protein n=1 Tax=Eretmocerus hayati TaxID=131215 RepID=A0ACC2PDW2_9HYME|nr:hypothetical protein QAD02_016536 [Eretmocerus hayati]
MPPNLRKRKAEVNPLVERTTSMKKSYPSNESLNDTEATDDGAESSRYSSVHVLPFAFNNFSKLPNKQGQSTLSVPMNIGNYKFKIRIFPGGWAKHDEGYVSFFVKLCEPSKAKITLSLSILLGTEKYFGTNITTFKYDSGGQNHCRSFGWTKFVEHKTLVDQVLSFSNDQLVILLEIFDLDVPGFSYQLKRLSTYGKLLNNRDFSDVKLIVGDKTIYVNKMILSNGNDVFAAMFKHNLKENKNNVIKVDDVSHQVMMELVRFIYTGQVRGIERIPKELLVAADKYGIDELKDQCGCYLSEILSIHNVLEYISFADLYNVDQLKKKAIVFFMTHRKDVVKIQNFKIRLQVLKPDLLADLMTGLIGG